MSRRVSRLRSVHRISRLLAVLVAVVAVGTSTVVPIEAASASASMSTSSTLARSSADPAQSGIAKTSLAGFKPGNIISNAVFTNEKTMSATKIQSFLNSKVSKCVSGYTCLKDLKVATQTKSADAYCSKYAGSSKESAARIIYKVAQACDLNPQVLLVMLQKEQGLVTHVWPSDWRYNAAMGQACPDTAPCDVAFAGFFAQVYGAARQMQIYLEGKWFQWYKAGNTWQIQYHPDRDRCGTSPVYIANKATEALYYYTPYQPNASALRAGYGEGDSCGSYGNRNFYNYFTDWFGSTQDTVCAPPNGGTRAASLAYVVTTSSTATRIAPRADCDTRAGKLVAGDIVQAIEISGSSKWLKVRTEAGYRWIHRGDVRKSSKAEAACTIPSGVGAAKLTYTIVSDTTARISPRSGCSLDSRTVRAGSSVTASKVSGSGLWLKVSTTHGVRWILRADTRKATSAEAKCAYPINATKARYGYVLTRATEMHDIPKTACGSNNGVVPKGTSVRAVEAVDGWVKVIVGDTEQWIDRAATRRASTAEAVCIEPAGSGPAKLSYVTTSAVTARKAPDSRCTTGSESVQSGTLITASAVSADGAWLKVGVGSADKWIPRADTRKATSTDLECPVPHNTRAAKLTYVVITPTTGRSAPTEACSSGSTAIARGSAFTATAVTADGTWLKTSISGSGLWVARGDVRKATQADLACVEPESRSAYKTYVVLDAGTVARVAPNTGCSTDALTLSEGTTITAVAATLSADWIKVRIDASERWVPRDAVRYATSADLSCTTPTKTTPAKLWYRTSTTTTVRIAPSTACTSGTETLEQDAVVEAAELSADGLWLKVRIGTAQKWVLRSEVQKIKSVLTTTSVNLRSSASDSSAIVTTLVASTRVAVLEEDGDWWKVQTRFGTGWISSLYLH